METVKILHMSLQPNTRTTMKQLILINVGASSLPPFSQPQTPT